MKKILFFFLLVLPITFPAYVRSAELTVNGKTFTPSAYYVVNGILDIRGVSVSHVAGTLDNKKRASGQLADKDNGVTVNFVDYVIRYGDAKRCVLVPYNFKAPQIEER